MKFEIESAANFLSNLLKLHSNILSPEQLDRFRGAIESCLEGHYENHWFPDRPTKGSGYRCIRINHKMDPLLARAGKSCGLDNQALKTIFPNELTLWIDPREVSYRIGENGSICVLFDGNSSGGSSDSDSGSTSSSGSSSVSSSPPNGSVVGMDQSKNSTIQASPPSYGQQVHGSVLSPSSNNNHNHHIGSHHNSSPFSMGAPTPGNRKHLQQQSMIGGTDHSSPLHPNQYPVTNVMRRSPSHNLNRTTSNGFSHYNGHQQHHQVQQQQHTAMNGHHSQTSGMNRGSSGGHQMNHSLNNGQSSHHHHGRGSPTDSSSTSTMSSPSPSSSPDWCKMGLVYDRRSSPEHWQRSPMSHHVGGQHNMNSSHHGSGDHGQQQHPQSMSSRQHSSPVSVMGHGSHGMDSHPHHHSQHSMGMYAYGPQQLQQQQQQQHQGAGAGYAYNPGVVNGHHRQQQQQQYSSGFGNRNFSAAAPHPGAAAAYAAANTWTGSPF